jgi:hypothetical protein
MTNINVNNLCYYFGRAIDQAVSLWLPTGEARVCARAQHVGFVVDKWHWGRFFPTTLVSLANHDSTNFSIIINTRGWHNSPIGDSSGLDPT